MATTIAAPVVEAGQTRRLAVVCGILLAGSLAAAATAADLGRTPLDEPEAWSVLRGAVVVSYAFVGAYTWWRRPSSRFGPFMILLAALFFLAAFAASAESVSHSFGRVAHAVLVVVLTYVFLCFPNDRLASDVERRRPAARARQRVAWTVAVAVVETLPLRRRADLVRRLVPGERVPARQRAGAGVGCAQALRQRGHLAVSARARAPPARESALPVRLQRRPISPPLLVCVAVMAVNYGSSRP